MVIMIELVQYAKNYGGNSRKNLVEHQIIYNDKKNQYNNLSFFRTPSSRLTHSVLLYPNLVLQILKFLKKCQIANYM